MIVLSFGDGAGSFGFILKSVRYKVFCIHKGVSFTVALVLADIKIIFFIAFPMVLCFGFLTKTVLIT